MIRQRKIATNLGRDLHVRDHSQNPFQTENHETYGTQIGEILFPEPEPFYKQNMVTVSLARGGRITDVAYPGAFIEPVTGNVHGVYEGPLPGQMVIVGFENGNRSSPYVVNRYPYQGVGNTLTELSYILPQTKAGYHSFDVVIGHFSGSFLCFNTGIFPSIGLPGSVTLSAMTDLEMTANTSLLASSLLSAEVKGLTAKLTGTTSSTVSAIDAKLSSTLGGAVDVQALVQIKSATQSMKTLVDSFITVLEGAYTINCVPGAPVTFDPAFIALLELEKAKWALLLSA